MTDEQKLERASQLRREAAALEMEVLAATPKCGRCLNFFQGTYCNAFKASVPKEFAEQVGNGCASWEFDEVPF